jgi:hypothetical protein
MVFTFLRACQQRSPNNALFCHPVYRWQPPAPQSSLKIIVFSATSSLIVIVIMNITIAMIAIVAAVGIAIMIMIIIAIMTIYRPH